MGTYRRKLLAVFGTIALACALCLLISKALAITVFGIGAVFVINRHLARCERCESWKTQVFTCQETDPDDTGRIDYAGRCCSACGHRERV